VKITKKPAKFLQIGTVAARTGLTVSAIRHYEAEGLITCHRSAGGNRLLEPADIRRLSFIVIAQNLGFTLKEVREQLDLLPQGRTPTKKDWDHISRHFGAIINKRIMALETLRSKLNNCIGCGCLSLKSRALYNADDRARKKGTGPRYLLGDKPDIK